MTQNTVLTATKTYTPGFYSTETPNMAYSAILFDYHEAQDNFHSIESEAISVSVPSVPIEDDPVVQEFLDKLFFEDIKPSRVDDERLVRLFKGKSGMFEAYGLAHLTQLQA